MGLLGLMRLLGLLGSWELLVIVGANGTYGANGINGFSSIRIGEKMNRKRLRSLLLVVMIAFFTTTLFSANYSHSANFSGKPKIDKETGYGYFLWRDKDKVWHLVTVSKEAPRTFSGEILISKGHFEVIEKEKKGIVTKIFGFVIDTIKKQKKAKEKKKKDKAKEKAGIKEDKTIKEKEKPKVKKNSDKEKKVLMEKLEEEDVVVVNDHKMVFSFKSKDEKRGFSFKIRGTAPCVKFDLKINGKRNIRKIYLGENKIKPKRLPFTKCR